MRTFSTLIKMYYKIKMIKVSMIGYQIIDRSVELFVDSRSRSTVYIFMYTNITSYVLFIRHIIL